LQDDVKAVQQREEQLKIALEKSAADFRSLKLKNDEVEKESAQFT
jgi:hypothetical protein